MTNKVKQKRRLRKTIARRQKEVFNERTARAWRRLFVWAGVLNG